MSLLDRIKNDVSYQLGIKIHTLSPLSGGCISSSFLLKTHDGQSFFLKVRSPHHPTDLLEKEANGLTALAETQTISIPQIILKNTDFLLLEYLNTTSPSNTHWKTFGTKLAKLHKNQSSHFGFNENNYLGLTEQKNQPQKKSWAEFYFENRLLFQYQLLEQKNRVSPELKSSFKLVEKKIHHILGPNESDRPQLIHGDLWSGNYICTEDDVYIFDPAVSFSHRELELAMTTLFGGLDSQFYHFYHQEYPLPADYLQREKIYQSYHLLNHMNLFGNSYLPQTLDSLQFYKKF